MRHWGYGLVIGAAVAVSLVAEQVTQEKVTIAEFTAAGQRKGVDGRR